MANGKYCDGNCEGGSIPLTSLQHITNSDVEGNEWDKEKLNVI